MFLQAKAQAEREERNKKLQLSKQSAGEIKRALVGEVKEEKRRLNEFVHQGRSAAEQEKHTKALEARQRYAVLFVLLPYLII